MENEMLKYWLDYKKHDPSPYVFNMIRISEKNVPCAEMKSFLGHEMLKAYRNIGYLKINYQTEPKEKLIEYINNYVIPSDANQISKNVRQGDFGETLASIIVGCFEGLVVPIHKLKWKFNKDKSVFCTDMIAHSPGGKITDIYYYEIKSRIQIGKEKEKKKVYNYITVIAHNSLLHDKQIPNEGIADFLSRLFFELEDFDNASKYADIVKNPNAYNKHYELFFIIEKTKYIEDILVELNNLPPSIHPLNVTVVLIENLDQLVIETQQELINNAVQQVYLDPK